jgi:hypothetical protein
MRLRDQALAETLKTKLQTFDEIRPLSGIHPALRGECLIDQMIDSIRRVRYCERLLEKNIDASCADARSRSFEPLKAAIWHKREGNIDEAFWLVFLFVHFGKNLRTEYELIKAVYGGFDHNSYWDWRRTSQNMEEFRNWLHTNQWELRERGKFGNHRKYESLNAFKRTWKVMSIGLDLQEIMRQKFRALPRNREMIDDYYFMVYINQ